MSKLIFTLSTSLTYLQPSCFPLFHYLIVISSFLGFCESSLSPYPHPNFPLSLPGKHKVILQQLLLTTKEKNKNEKKPHYL